MRRAAWLVIFLFSFSVLAGFDFSRHSIPLDEIRSGGPPKDGIPSLTDPAWLAAGEAGYLKPGDRVIGFTHGDEARAYPIRILNWHEVINDIVGDTPVAVVYCPLCGSATVFDARAGVERMIFGVSGRLYNSDVLIYDHKTESLWSQIKMEAVTGPLTGTRLNLLDSANTTWQDWRGRYPGTKVLSLDTGHRRDYGRDPYAGYDQDRALFFPVGNKDDRLHPKEWVLGVVYAGAAKAYVLSALQEGDGSLEDTVGGQRVVVHVIKEARSAWVTDSRGDPVPAMQAYWFAWAAFYPETGLYTGGSD